MKMIMMCPFCLDYPDPIDIKPYGVFTTTYGNDMINHIYTIHDDLTPKDIIKKLVNLLQTRTVPYETVETTS